MKFDKKQRSQEKPKQSAEWDFGEWAERVKKKNTLCWYAMEMLRHFFADNMSRSSAELSYYLLFSMFPLLLLISLLLSLLHFSSETLLRITALLPSDIQKILLPTLTRYLGDYEIQPHYGQIVFFSLMTIYFMSRMMSSLMRHVNGIYGIPNARGGLRQFFFEIATAAGLVFALMMSFVLAILGREITALANSLLSMPSWLLLLIKHGRSLLTLGFVFLFMLIICYWMPNCKMLWKDTLAGAVFILCAWIVCSLIFTYYFNNFSRYDVIYGSIGAIMVLLLWLYMTGIVIQLGFTINYITMQRRKRDFIYKNQLSIRRRSDKNNKIKGA